ncbi:hypothetical protein EV424DRAFT_1427976, partial [Suillus variegatus]
RIPIPVRNFASDPCVIVVRSFDVNKPGAEVDEAKGVARSQDLSGCCNEGHSGLGTRRLFSSRTLRES